MGHWIVGVTSFQKIYGLYSVEHHKVEKWSYYVGCGWVLWVWWVCVGDGGVGIFFIIVFINKTALWSSLHMLPWQQLHSRHNYHEQIVQKSESEITNLTLFQFA